jgi:hypothetical protein
MGNRVERLIHQHSTQRIWGTSTSRVYVRSARTKICIVESEVLHLRILKFYFEATRKQSHTAQGCGLATTRSGVAATLGNDGAKLPLYTMPLISIHYEYSPLSIYVFPILLQQKLIELLRSPIYHTKSGPLSNLLLQPQITLRAVGRHIKLGFLEILNWTAGWPIGDLVSPCCSLEAPGARRLGCVCPGPKCNHWIDQLIPPKPGWQSQCR